MSWCDWIIIVIIKIILKQNISLKIIVIANLNTNVLLWRTKTCRIYIY